MCEYILAYWWAVLWPRLLVLTSVCSRPCGTTSGQSKHFLGSGLKKIGQKGLEAASLFIIRPSWLITSWRSEHRVRGRCSRQDYSCHKCPVMQQSHKQFFFFFAGWSQWTALVINTPPPLLKPNACHSPYPHQPPAFPHVHKPTHVNTKPKQPIRPWRLETH